MESLAWITDLNLGSRWEGRAGSHLQVVVASQVQGAKSFRTHTPNTHTQGLPGSFSRTVAAPPTPLRLRGSCGGEQLGPLNPGSAQSQLPIDLEARGEGINEINTSGEAP